MWEVVYGNQPGTRERGAQCICLLGGTRPLATLISTQNKKSGGGVNAKGTINHFHFLFINDSLFILIDVTSCSLDPPL